MYHLTDPEEDDDVSREASASDGHCGDQEKRKAEEDEEEEGGITFRVQHASTPEEKTRKRQERPVVLPIQSVLSPHDSPTRPAPPSHPDPCSPAAPLDPTNKLLSTSAPSSGEFGNDTRASVPTFCRPFSQNAMAVPLQITTQGSV